jgi:hypothetical protein
LHIFIKTFLIQLLVFYSLLLHCEFSTLLFLQVSLHLLQLSYNGFKYLQTLLNYKNLSIHQTIWKLPESNTYELSVAYQLVTPF